MGDDPATWRCRSSQWASDGPALPHGRRDPSHIEDDGSLRLGPAQVSDGSQPQRRQARQAIKASEASMAVKPEAATRTAGGPAILS
jgi:hypothetical protein